MGEIRNKVLVVLVLVALQGKGQQQNAVCGGVPAFKFDSIKTETRDNIHFYVRGRVTDSARYGDLPFASVILLDSLKSHGQTQTTDIDGNFVYKDVLSGIYYIKISMITIRDSLFGPIYIHSDTSLVFNTHKYCRYDASKNNKRCPACHQKDMTIPIAYGIPVYKNKKKYEKDVDVKFHPAGCVITGCDPNWYCKRDSTAF